jgi:hypothetical protein
VRAQRLADLRHGFARPGEAVPDPLWRPRQVHGARVVGAAPPGSGPEEADAVVSVEPGRPAAVVTADCAAVLLAAADGRVVAAVHAGWRGLAAGVVEQALAALRAAGADGLRAAIGPAAGACCYEVGPEVITALTPRPERVDETHGRRPRLDLRGVVEDRLVAAGIERGRVERVGPCTICSTAWPSYRREGAAAGRLVAWIVPEPSA